MMMTWTSQVHCGQSDSAVHVEIYNTKRSVTKNTTPTEHGRNDREEDTGDEECGD